MINVYRSDTGQYVLVHPYTQTVIIDEQLEPAFDKMQSFIREHYPDSAARLMQPFDSPPKPSPDVFTRARILLLFALVALPFIWLLGLHYSMSSVVTDFMAEQARAREHPAWEAPVERLRQDVDALGQRVMEFGGQSTAAPKGAAN